jgi:hypothetical protein
MVVKYCNNISERNGMVRIGLDWINLALDIFMQHAAVKEDKELSSSIKRTDHINDYQPLKKQACCMLWT